MGNINSKSAAILALVFLSIFLTACGDGGSSSPTNSTTSRRQTLANVNNSDQDIAARNAFASKMPNQNDSWANNQSQYAGFNNSNPANLNNPPNNYQNLNNGQSSSTSGFAMAAMAAVLAPLMMQIGGKVLPSGQNAQTAQNVQSSPNSAGQRIPIAQAPGALTPVAPNAAGPLGQSAITNQKPLIAPEQKDPAPTGGNVAETHPIAATPTVLDCKAAFASGDAEVKQILDTALQNAQR